MAVDEHRHDPVVGEAAADLERRVDRLPDLDRVGADLVADLAPEPVDGRVRLGHRHDREGLPKPAEEYSADLPVAEMPADEDYALALFAQPLEQRAIGL